MAKIHRTKLQGLPSYFTSWGLKPFNNDAAFVTAKGSVATEGDAYYNSTDDEIRVFDGTNWRTVITADASGNVIIDGNLTVDGTTVTLNTQTLDVEDANIIVNHNGNQTSADNVAGITVEMSDAQDAALIYDKDVASKFLIGETNTLKEVATVSDTQTLTNKTIAAGNNTISGLLHGTHVDNPTSGVHGVTGSVVGTTDTQTLTGKTIDGDLNTISNLAHGAEVDNPTSGVHGVTGNVVGTTDTQTLTGKTIDGDLNTISNLAHGAEVDNPASGVHGVTGNVVGTTDTQTLTNKTIDAALNTISNIDNADIATGAAITRNKLANGTADHVIINDASGVMSSEAALAKVRGGTGADNSSVTFPSTGVIVTEAGTQTLSNKSISDALTYSHITTPANPSAGALKIYAKNDDKFYKLNSVGEEVEIGSGAGGAGGINFFLNGDFETNINDWTSSDAGVALSAETAAPLVGTRSLLVTKDAANRESEFVSGTARGIDLAYRGRPLPFSFEFDTTAANYASDDVRVAVYDNTNAAYLYVAPVSNVSDTLGLLKTSGKALVMVYPESTTASITPRLIINSTNATSYALKFDAFKIGPDMVVPGAIITEWQSYTPTFSAGFGTVSAVDVKYRRVGSNIEIHGTVTTGTVAASAATMTLPDGLLSGTINTMPQGRWYRSAAGATTVKAGPVVTVSNSNTVSFSLDDYTTAASPFDAANGNAIFASTQIVRFNLEAPIVEWSAGASLSTTEVAFQTDTIILTKSANQNISDSTNTEITFNTVTKKGASLELDSNGIKFNQTGWYLYSYSIALTSMSGTDNRVRIFSTVYPELDSDNVGIGDRTTVTKTSLIYVSTAGQVRPLQIFQNGGAGTTVQNAGTFISAVRLPDFSTFSVFGQSEELASTSGSIAAWPFTASNFGDLTSLVLQPGKYILSGFVTLDNNGALASAPLALAGISTTSGNSGTGLIEANNQSTIRHPLANGQYSAISTPQVYVTVTTPTTYYLKGWATVVTNLRYRGYSLKAIKYQ